MLLGSRLPACALSAGSLCWLIGHRATPSLQAVLPGSWLPPAAPIADEAAPQRATEVQDRKPSDQTNELSQASIAGTVMTRCASEGWRMGHVGC